jgi:hypothetical protein
VQKAFRYKIELAAKEFIKACSYWRIVLDKHIDSKQDWLGYEQREAKYDLCEMQLRRIKQIAEEEEAKTLNKLLVLASAAREEQ